MRYLLKKITCSICLLGTLGLSGNVLAATDVDWLVEGDYVVTMDAQHQIIADGAIAIQGEKIVAVGKAAALREQYHAKHELSGTNRIVMPGLINGHTHSSMTLFRGLADDLDLMTWLKTYVFPMEARFVDQDFVKTGSTLACWEFIRSGTTTVVDMYFYPQTIAQVYQQCGIRAIVAAPMIDFPSPGFKGWDDSFAAGLKYVEQQQGKSDRIIAGFAPHAPYSVAPEHLSQVLDVAKKLHAPISMHLSEAPAEVQQVQQKYHTTSVRLLKKLGFLDQWVIGAHVVWPDDEEIDMLAHSSVGAIHNPTSNMKGAAGFMPVPKMLKAGVSVGLGTDGAAGNNDLDMWDEVKLAALLHKGHTGDTTAVSATEAIDMATRLGARAVGLDQQIGQLKPGMQADLIQISTTSPRMHPLYHVMSHLAYVVKAEDVQSTMVAGQLLMDNGKVLTVDSAAVIKAADAKAQQIVEALKARGVDNVRLP